MNIFLLPGTNQDLFLRNKSKEHLLPLSAPPNPDSQNHKICGFCSINRHLCISFKYFDQILRPNQTRVSTGWEESRREQSYSISAPFCSIQRIRPVLEGIIESSRLEVKTKIVYFIGHCLGGEIISTRTIAGEKRTSFPEHRTILRSSTVFKLVWVWYFYLAWSGKFTDFWAY